MAQGLVRTQEVLLCQFRVHLSCKHSYVRRIPSRTTPCPSSLPPHLGRREHPPNPPDHRVLRSVLSIQPWTRFLGTYVESVGFLLTTLTTDRHPYSHCLFDSNTGTPVLGHTVSRYEGGGGKGPEVVVSTRTDTAGNVPLRPLTEQSVSLPT